MLAGVLKLPRRKHLLGDIKIDFWLTQFSFNVLGLDP